LAVDRLRSRLDLPARILLEVAGLDRLVVLPGEPGHALPERNLRGDLHDLRRDVDRRRDLQQVAADDVDRAGDRRVATEQIGEPLVDRLVEHGRTLRYDALMFTLDEQTQMVAGVIRQWCQSTLVPRIPALEAGTEMPFDLMKRFAKQFG